MTYQLECKKDGLRQTQDGLWKFTVTVHPDDMPDEILKAPMGTHYIVVFAEYDGGEPQEEERRKFEEMPRSQQAGMLCQDKPFQQWLGCFDSGQAAMEVRIRCGVESRSDLDHTDMDIAIALWDKLVADYRSKMGLRL